MATKAKDIEDAVYDLKAVNPNRKPVVDTRTPEELMDVIEEKGREVSHALAALRERDEGMNDKRPQTIQFFLPQGKPRDVRWAEISVRIVGLFREGHYGCGGVQAVVVYSETMP